MQQFRQPDVLMRNSSDGRWFAGSLKGFGALRYLTAGRSKSLSPLIDTAYTVGGFWLDDKRNTLYWSALGVDSGCALLRWDFADTVQVLHAEPFPCAFKIAGIDEGAQRILLQRGLIDRGQLREGDFYLIDLAPLQNAPLRPLSQISLQHLLPPEVYSIELASELSVYSSQRVGEFWIGQKRNLLARVALGEGESGVFSLWRVAKGGLHRTVPNLEDITSWSWLSSPKGLVVVAATGVYAGEPGSIVGWREGSSRWRVIQRNPTSVAARLIRVESKGRVSYETVSASGSRRRFQVIVGEL